ncbi:pyridine nucleotide-disulfide oxidoreductase domain-containing protein 2 isoform X6 [Amborella trichopoda]|uniref:pyridine nucleotide-disulfide oxidoreductase domain-containing protein 2 isoform X6 n=1 Tax=Amborella trichopoda TaxID=13333 RepID=UPI0009BF7F74|nr:pyridine nucleotide-disulfide oxidoreductase domain-containing protein 2 isoform X6 [Amborella trichopoda]|eukprot:XP_020530292.1 pyridine nucleotide-disulfide oxidoreductase domain-containing protein 2 isoform X6 [Amborella trichopoda]
MMIRMRRRWLSLSRLVRSTTTIIPHCHHYYHSSSSSHQSSSQFLNRGRKWDAVVIGGGHNGLTAAAYLAKSGLKVAVLERRHVIGGAAVTEELIPGFKFSRCSYLHSLLRPCVIKELDLKRHGLRFLKRNPSSFTPCLDGRYLLLGPDATLNHSEISKFSERDAIAYPKYEGQLTKFCNIMDSLLDLPTPEIKSDLTSSIDFMADKFKKSAFWARLLQQSFLLGQKDMVDFMELMVSPASRVLNNWFEVCHVTVDESSGRVNGVMLSDGTHVFASNVLSNATPYLTFMELVPKNVIPEEFMNAIRNLDYSSGTTKINIAVDRLPHFQCCRPDLSKAGPQHHGTIHIGAESLEELDIAYKDGVNGLPSKRPIIEMTIPSVLDKTISPPGKHVVNLFVQYTPYKLSEGCWQDLSFRESFARRCFALIDEYAPGFSSSIIGYDMLSPPDLEKEFGLTGGNIFHGAMSLDSLFLMRPVKGWSGYRTPLRGLYLCGSGSHPGGGVMGAPGRNAANVVLQDIKTSAA